MSTNNKGRGLESEKERRTFIDSHRLAYIDEVAVNWCQELGTVLANEEVIDEFLVKDCHASNPSEEVEPLKMVLVAEA